MFKFAHNNLTVLNLERSKQFYAEALDLHEVGGFDADSDLKIIHLADSYDSHHKLELTFNFNRSEPYNLGDNKVHLAFTTKNFAESYVRHKKMHCICQENLELGIYFIVDPDGYRIEIMRE